MCTGHCGSRRSSAHSTQIAVFRTMSGIRTTCPYCGVGCGVIASQDGVLGDPAHPANFGRLCSKGTALAETLDDSRRLLRPRIYGRDASWDAALSLIAKRFRETVAHHGP